MATPPPITWDQLLPEARTGDLVLFHDGDFLGEAIEVGTGGRFSHSAMIVRPDPSAAPLIWQESGVALADDPKSKTKHTGAQLGDLRSTVSTILEYHDHPWYRRLNFDRTPEFEEAVQEVVTTCEGVPFPTILHMAERWFEGHFLGKAEGNGEMFCSQLVALTFQRAGLLSLEHPPNFYSPNSFSMANPHLALLQGASFDAEVPIQMDEG